MKISWSGALLLSPRVFLYALQDFKGPSIQKLIKWWKQLFFSKFYKNQNFQFFKKLFFIKQTMFLYKQTRFLYKQTRFLYKQKRYFLSEVKNSCAQAHEFFPRNQIRKNQKVYFSSEVKNSCALARTIFFRGTRIGAIKK